MFRVQFTDACLLSLLLLATGCGQPPDSTPMTGHEAASNAATLTAVTEKPIVISTTAPKSEAIAESPSASEPASRDSDETLPKETIPPPLARNPFQPPTVTVRTLTPNQVQTADIRLLGIAKRDDQRFVIVENAGELNKAAVGDLVGDWEVVRIGDTQVTLRRELEEILLTIK